MYITHVPERVSIKGYKENDCTITALGTALGLSYDLSKKVLQTAEILPSGLLTFRKRSPRTKPEFSRKYFIDKLCSELCVKKIHYKEKRKLVSFEEFAEENQKGVYLVLSKNHIAAIIDGRLVDSWNSSKNIVEIAYLINIKTARVMIRDLAIFYKMSNPIHMLLTPEKAILEKHENSELVTPTKTGKTFGKRLSKVEI